MEAIYYLTVLYTCSTGHLQKNGAASNVMKKFISHPRRVKHTLPAAGTLHVSHTLPAVRFSSLLQGRVRSDGVEAGEGFLFALF
jgi:hypothetical protein